MTSDPLTDELRETLDVFERAPVGEPLTSAEVAEHLGLGRRTTYERLGRLADDGHLETKTVGARARVWWLPRPAAGGAEAASDSPADRRRLETYEQIVEAVSDGIYTVDSEGHFTMVNRAYAELTGYPREELVGAHVSKVVDQGTIDTARGVEEELASGDRDAVTFQADVRTAAGDALRTEGAFTLLQTESGADERIGVIRDLTEREQTEDDLRRSEARFRTMMEQSPFSMQIFDAEGQVLEANPAWERLWDASREELTDYNLFEDEQLQAAGITPYFREAFAGDVVELPVTHYDPAEIGKPGRDRWIQGYAYPLLSDSSGVAEVALVHHDVTERKQRERELQRVRERMEFALNTTDAAVWDWNVEDDEASFYPSAESVYGTTVDDWDDFIAVIHPDDREKVEAGIRTSLETGEAKSEEIRIVRDGAVRWIEAPGQPIQDDGPPRMVGVVRDITERKTYERRLEESNERLEQFAYAASHDLQEPLRMVSSYLRLIERRYADELDDDGREFIDFAVDGADRMREMIEALLEYSRVETEGDPFEPVDLNEVLEDALTDLQLRIEERDAAIATEELPAVEGDRNQLRQVFHNLLKNAIAYSGDGPPRVHVSAERTGDGWVVSVRDEGIGIDPEDQDRIFEIFQRLHTQAEHDGTGIGLALTRRIVERHGGEIWVDSDPGDGATFSLTVPATETTT